MLPVETPFKTYTDLNGKPLDQGFVYFGQPNQNPITAPVTVYWDAAGIVPAAQPLRTMNGYIMRAGTPANVFFDGAYSELVLDSKKRQVFYAKTSLEFSIAAVVSKFLLDLAGSTGAALIGFIQTGVNAAKRTLLDKARERVSIDDFFVAGEADDTLMLKRAAASGARRVVGNGKTYVVSDTIPIPANLVFDGEGGQVLTSDGTQTKNVLLTTGAGSTIQNWSIGSNAPGTRKGFYGLLIDQPGTTVRNVSFRDITYTALFNDAEGTQATGIFAQNCGWDAVSNFQRAKNSTFRNVRGIANGRSLVSTDVGAKGIVVDGFESIDNGLDEITSEHKDTLHFEGAADCVFRNGVIRYTLGYAGGTINQTWALMRWNASTNCAIENVDIKLESSANGKLILGLIDTEGANGNTKCAASNINVDATTISGHLLKFLNYDGASRFKLMGGNWRGNLRVEAAVAGGNTFQSIKRLEMDGPGTGTALYSQFVTNDWDVSELKIRGYTSAFSLAGFQDSTIANCDIDGVTYAFEMLNVNAGADYQPNGGAITNNIIKMQSGTVLRTNNQQTRPMIYAHNIIDGSASIGLDVTGGSAGSTTAHVRGIGNVINGSFATIQNGTNAQGVFNTNMNNLSQ